MTMINDINEKQNEPEAIALLKAADAAHMHARLADTFRVIVSGASVVGAMIASVRSELAQLVAALAVGGVVASETVRYLLALRWTRMAMLLQELFDTTLFGLGWDSTVGKRPRQEDRRYWEKKFHDDRRNKENWYINVRGLPLGHAVLLCQRQNLSWDARLRGIWGSALIVAVVSWITLGLLLGALWEWKVWDLIVRWIVPSTPALLYAVRSGIRHRQIAADKDQLIGRVEDLLSAIAIRSTAGRERILVLARQFQTLIARLRSEETRVPSWLYTWLRGDYEDEAAAAAEKWRDQLLREATSPDPKDVTGSAA